MTTGADAYVFSDAGSDRELARLRQLESVFDDASRRVLRLAAPRPRVRCLEVGAGAGSVARWLASAVGPEGHVTAMDVNTRFLEGARAPMQVVECDIREYEAPTPFDVVHARYVLTHLVDPERALERMIRALAPGGWLVLEEADFSAGRAGCGPSELIQAFERVNRAVRGMFTGRGVDPAFALRLPGELASASLELVHVENDAPLVAGQSALARMMRASAEYLAPQYVATGAATADDVAAYCAFAEDPATWGIYYGTVRVCARKPR